MSHPAIVVVLFLACVCIPPEKRLFFNPIICRLSIILSVCLSRNLPFLFHLLSLEICPSSEFVCLETYHYACFISLYGDLSFLTVCLSRNLTVLFHLLSGDLSFLSVCLSRNLPFLFRRLSLEACSSSVFVFVETYHSCFIFSLWRPVFPQCLYF
jgi:hypothetical protein